jgi:hypothetical protein
MTERWRRALGRLDGAEPDRDRISSLAEQGTRMPGGDGDSGSGRRVLAAAIALAVAAGSFALVVTVFRGGDSRDSLGVSPTPPTAPPASGSGPASPTGPAPALDPAAICDVPTYDPDVALLVGTETVQYPLGALEEPGAPASSLQGPAADALVARLADPKAANAPTDGWREIASSPTKVTFAAPLRPGDWWVEAFAEREGAWRQTDEEIARQHETPAQLGHGLRLRWNGDLVLHDGSWNDPLQLVNGRSEAWTGEQMIVAVPQLFDPATGRLVGPGAYPLDARIDTPAIAPGSALGIPVAIGASLAATTTGEYRVVACIPELGLASPVGTLRVENDAVVPDVDVLAFAPGGAYNQPLFIGTLEIDHGCLATHIGGEDRVTYLVLPQGYAFVERDGHRVLIDPLGNQAAELGDELRMTGGTGSLQQAEDYVVGGIPDACRAPGARYLFTPSV